jgi:transcriptional regulator with XRE-family HTH domain
LTNLIDPRLGKRLRQVREARGLSQGKLAQLIGVSVGTVQNYEHSRNRIPADRIAPIAVELQCRPADLLMSPDSPTPPPRRRYLMPLWLAAALATAPVLAGPPELALDLKQFADKFDRIDADDLA